MILPRLLVLTDRRASERAGRLLTETVSAAVDAGMRALLLREKDLDRDARTRIAEDLLGILGPRGATLVVASDEVVASRVGVEHVHLAAADPIPHGRATFHGRSCHGPREVRRAVETGASWLTVSPVDRTRTKPGHGPPLAEAGVRALVGLAGGLPVFALGGVTARNAPRWFSAGVHGVAVLGAVMAADSPVASVRELLLAVGHGAARTPG